MVNPQSLSRWIITSPPFGPFIVFCLTKKILNPTTDEHLVGKLHQNDINSKQNDTEPAIISNNFSKKTRNFNHFSPKSGIKMKQPQIGIKKQPQIGNKITTKPLWRSSDAGKRRSSGDRLCARRRQRRRKKEKRRRRAGGRRRTQSCIGNEREGVANGRERLERYRVVFLLG